MESTRISSWIVLFVFCYILVSIVVCGQSDYGTDHDYVAPVLTPAPGIIPTPTPGPGLEPAPALKPHPILSNVFTVTDYGAIGDSVTDNRQAFVETWEKACGTGDSTIVVPGGTFFLNSITFEGPCNGPIEIQLIGTLAAPPDASFGQEFWIMFLKVDSLTLSGPGAFDGKGGVAWDGKRLINQLEMDGAVSFDKKDSNPSKERPSSIKLKGVTNSIIDGITSGNSKMFHINIFESQGITVQNVNIVAPADSPNTDGIHIAHSSNIKIYNTVIATGDDCISISDGSTNVDINMVRCGPGHGISIGSLGKHEKQQDVSGISVTNCDLTNTTNGLRIKSWATPFPSSAYNITFDDIRITSVLNPIIIDQHYCPHKSCTKKGESSVAIKDVKFINIRGESAQSVSVILDCSQTTPCKGIEFSQLKLTLNGQPTTARCTNAENTFLEADQMPSQCSA